METAEGTGIAIQRLGVKRSQVVACESEVSQLCLTLRDPMDCSLPGFSAHGTFQARVLEWVAISSSVVSNSLRPSGLQPTRLSVHGAFQARILELPRKAYFGSFLVRVIWVKITARITGGRYFLYASEGMCFVSLSSKRKLKRKVEIMLVSGSKACQAKRVAKRVECG